MDARSGGAGGWDPRDGPPGGRGFPGAPGGPGGFGGALGGFMNHFGGPGGAMGAAMGAMGRGDMGAAMGAMGRGDMGAAMGAMGRGEGGFGRGGAMGALGGMMGAMNLGGPGGRFGNPDAPGGRFGNPDAPGGPGGRFGNPDAPGGPGGRFGNPDAPGAPGGRFGNPEGPGARFGNPDASGGRFGDQGYGGEYGGDGYARPGFGRGGDGYGPGPGRTNDWFDGGRDGRFGQGPPGRMDNPYGRDDRYGPGGRMGGNYQDDEFEDGPGGRFMGGAPYQGAQPPYPGSGPVGASAGYGPYGRQRDEFNRPYDGGRPGDDFGRPPYDGGRPGMREQDEYGRAPYDGTRAPPGMGRQSPYHSPYHGSMQGPGAMAEGMGPLSLSNPDLPMQQISLEMSAKGLKKNDLIGKSDPVCYVYLPEDRIMDDGRATSPASLKWKVLSRTEIIKNTHSPTWGTRVNINHLFQEYQLLRFSIYDADGEYDNPRSGDKIGECCVSLGEIVRRGVVTVQLVRNLRNSSGSGSGRYGALTIRAHSDSVEGKIRLKVNFSARNLPKSDTFGKADPFYVFTHIGASGEESKKIHQSEVVNNTLNPDWRPRRDLISAHGKPWDRIKLRVTIYDHDTGGKSDLLGSVDFTLQQLTRYSKFDVINEKAAASEGGRYQNSGELIVNKAEVMRMPPFMDYLQGGLLLHFLVCVDFSNSGERGSLHESRGNSGLSMYGQALSAIGTILSGYLSDGMIAALGFGAKPRYSGRQMGGGRHEPFPLNENPNDPRVMGVEGLLEVYHRALESVRDGSKTKFEPVIRHAMRLTENRQVTQAQQHFTILLVLTDGEVDDMEETVDAIIECSYSHPVAIVFVGVGRGDFSDMKRLDGDKETLKSERTNKRAKHDIVQFSQFKPHDSIESLAGSVLKEIPRRIVTYMMDLGITPNAPLHQRGGMGHPSMGHHPGMPPMGGPLGSHPGGPPGAPPGIGPHGGPPEMNGHPGPGRPPHMGGRPGRSPHMNAMSGPPVPPFGPHDSPSMGHPGAPPMHPPHMQMLPPGMGPNAPGGMHGHGGPMGMSQGMMPPHMQGNRPPGAMGMRGPPEGGMPMPGMFDQQRGEHRPSSF